MAFSYKNKKGDTYYLHARRTELKNGNERTIYFFSREQKEGTIDAVPEGFEIDEMQTGLPMLRKSGGKEAGGKSGGKSGGKGGKG